MDLKRLDAGFFFSLFFTVCFAYGVVDAFQYDFLARIFPLYVSAALLLVAVVALGMDIRRLAAGKRVPVANGMDSPVVWRRFVSYLGLFAAIYLGIWVVGYPVAMTLSIVVLYRYLARASWGWSLVAGGAGFGFLVMASSLLHMDWPEGLIALPWPLG
ncbi:MAG: hypothetical protein H5U10_14525 [Desulfacinum sp.]|jgi:hypothetical protein|nr:hypothetical protein [Desulfacinum sp.]MBZ4658850.1 hypothetical protein [Desulfacinum sp.]